LTADRGETIEVVGLGDDGAPTGRDSDDKLVEMVWQLQGGTCEGAGNEIEPGRFIAT